MSGTSTPTGTSDNHTILAIGQQCSEASCLLVDFLPFKCQHCREAFCGEHFLPAAHSCKSYDESKHNRVAPACPLCNTPIAIPPGQDPNIRMEQHINSQCSYATGKPGKKKSAPVCNRGKCGKVLFAPIRCPNCKKEFCPQHRFPTDHNCGSSTGSQHATGTNTLANFAAATSAASAHTVNALRRTVASATNPTTSSQTTTPRSSTSSPAQSSTSFSNPFSQADRTSLSNTTHDIDNNASPTLTTDNSATLQPTVPSIIDPIRAKAERESKRRAMQERARKGLLSEEEKKKLELEEGEHRQVTDGCIVA